MEETKKTKHILGSVKDSKYRRAVGLNYNDSSNSAPVLSLKGERLRADEIVQLAKKYNVPIIENPELARALDSLDLDQEIPEELYEAVALLLNQIEQIEE